MPNDPDARDATPASLRSLQVIWLAFLFSIVIYAIVSWIIPVTPDVGDRTRTLDSWFSDPLSIALHIAGIASIAAGYFVPIIMIRQMRSRGHGPAEREPISAFEVVPEIRTALLVRYVLFETAAVLGLVLAVISGYWQLFLPLGLISLLALLFSSPSAELIRRLDEAAR
jgi:hypothetical protein